MSKHSSSVGDDSEGSRRDAATESLPIRSTDAAADASAHSPVDRSGDTAADASAGAARTAAAGSSTAETKLGGAWVSPDAQNAATVGVVASSSSAAKKARTKVRGPWYRRRIVVGAVGVALLAGSFAAGWGTNELLGNLRHLVGYSQNLLDEEAEG